MKLINFKKLLLIWLKKLVSDFHNAVISLIVLGIVTTAFLANILKSTINLLTWKIELWISIVFSLLLLLCYEILRSFITRKTIYFEYFGVKWDKKYNAHCPKCEFTLIENNEHFNPESTALCNKCDWEEQLKDETGKSFRLKEAKEIVKSLRK